MFSTIFSVCFLFFAVLFIGLGALISRKRHWSKALAKMILSIISAVLAFLLTSLVVPTIGNTLLETILTTLDGSSVAELLTEIPSAHDTLLVFMDMLIAPIFFIVVFAILKPILCLALYRPVAKLCLIIAGAIKKENYPSDVITKKQQKVSAISIALGAVCSMLVYITFLIPVTETAVTVATIGKAIDNEGIVYEVSESLTDNVGTAVVHTVGAPVWKAATHFSVNEETVSVATETHFIATFVEALGEISSQDADAVHHSAETFRELSKLCPETSLVPRFCSEFINAADEKWLNGDDFMGIEMPTLSIGAGSSGDNNILKTFLECLNGSTTETMKEDLAVLLKSMAVIAENAKLDESGHIDMAPILENKDIISAFSVELLQSPRLAPAMNVFIKNHMKNTNTYIELPGKESQEYTDLVDGILNTYKKEVGDVVNAESLDKLSNAIGDTLAENGVYLEEHERIAIASTFIGEFGDGQELTPEEVSDFIEEYRAQ